MTKLGQEPVSILAPRGTAQRISRRAFLAGSTVAVFSSSVLLSACGGDEASLNFYNWDAYDDPALIEKFTGESGTATKIDIYANNEVLISKLTTASGTAGYDVVVPTGPYVPLMVENDLLEELDFSKIPNFANVDPLFTDQSWDPGNRHSVIKDWGSTGWMYDKTKVTSTISTWQDFIDVAMTEASGNTSLLDAPNEMYGLYFWAKGIDWNTSDPADYDEYEDFMVNELAQHLKGFESYAGVAVADGTYALSQVWNGDARIGILGAEDPDQFVWGLGAPATELWMDNWAIVKGAEHLDAAYDWINFILDPANSLQDLAFHGYNTGVKGVKEAAEAAGNELLDLVFFTEEQLATTSPQVVTDLLDRQVEIYNKILAAAGA